VAVLGRFPGIRLVLLPVSIVSLYVFALGLSWFVGSIAVYLRDVLQILPTLMLIGFFASPISYVPSMVSGKLALLVAINPVSPFLALFRASLLPTAEFAWHDLALALLWAGGAFVVGGATFR